MTGTRHTAFPHDGDAGVEAHLVEAETGDESLTDPLAEAERWRERERLQREARRAYQDAGGVTVSHARPPGAPIAPEEDGVDRTESRDSGALVPDEPVGSTEQRLADVCRERDEYLDSLRRIQADFENYRKRTMKQETAAAERAAEALVEKLLPVLDTVDLARRHAAQGQPVEDAVNMIAVGIAEALAREGLERIDPDGQAFDPSEHEAVAHEPAGPSDAQGGEPAVVEVMRAGYRWKGRVLRAAMVKVRG